MVDLVVHPNLLYEELTDFSSAPQELGQSVSKKKKKNEWTTLSSQPKRL